MEHINAEILRAIADGKKVQYRHTPSGWEFFDSSDGFLCWKLLKGSAIEWRIAPKTVKIGDVEVPEPCRVAPERNTNYWTFTPYLGVVKISWSDTYRDHLSLNSGFLHLTEEAAEQHYEAIKNLLKEK